MSKKSEKLKQMVQKWQIESAKAREECKVQNDQMFKEYFQGRKPLVDVTDQVPTLKTED